MSIADVWTSGGEAARAACVITTTWNSIDLIETFLAHYQRLGFDQVMAMDFDSTDGTRDVLASAQWREFVTLVPFPGIASLDSSNLMLAIAQRDRRYTWCLFCDPDELLATPAMTVGDLLDGGGNGGSRSVPRFNMTAPLSVALRGTGPFSHVVYLTLRIDRRALRSPERDISKARLDPPWIFTDIPGKVFVRLDETIAIGDGDHIARTTREGLSAAPPGASLLHYPFRRYETFREKIELARRGFAANGHLPQAWGWQLRRWITLADSGQLNQEYLQQFIPDEQVAHLVEDRTLYRDERVSRFHDAPSR